MISLTNLTKSYRLDEKRIKAVDRVSLEVERGEFAAILGHSGSGKTTLLNLMGGLTKPDSGTVCIDGTDLWSMDDNALSEFRNEKLNFIFQFSSLIPTLSVLENVLLPTAFSRASMDYTRQAVDLLDRVGLADKKDAYPYQLSGGQQRRTAIARAFINEPAIILADEPTGDLDEETEQEMVDLFRRFNQEENVTFLIVTHSSELAAQTRRRFKMTNGCLAAL